MSKIKIIYEFDSVNNNDDIKKLMQYRDVLNSLCEFAEYLRQLNKYAKEDVVRIEEVYNKFWEILNEYKVEI